MFNENREIKDITGRFILFVLLMLLLAGATAWCTFQIIDRPREIRIHKIQLDDRVAFRLTREGKKYLSRHHHEEIQGDEINLDLREFAVLIGPYLNIGESHEIIQNGRLEVKR